MQRKRRNDNSVAMDFGSHILQVKQIRKLTLKRLLKCFVFVILVFTIYSIYQKIADVSTASQTSTLDDLKTSIQMENLIPRDEDLNKGFINELHNRFEEYKHKNKSPLNLEDKKRIFNDIVTQADENEDLINDIYDVEDEEKEEAFEADHPSSNNDNDDDIDEDQEKRDKQIEHEIEVRLAEAFNEAVNKVADNKDKVIPKPRDDEKVNTENNLEHNINLETKHEDQKLKAPHIQQVFEKDEFKMAVKEVGKKLHPLEIKKLNEKAAREARMYDSDHEFPPFVTAARQSTFNQVTQLVASIQQNLPGRKIYIYDLDLTKEEKKQLMSFCGVRMRLFMLKLFPTYVSNLDNLHWKPLVIQAALAELGHLIWINPQFRLSTQELAPLIHESHEKGIIVVGQSAGYSTYSATHPDMYNFIPSDKEKLSYHPHIEIRAILLHNTPEVHDNVMKLFTACALEESCLAPKGAKWQCKFDFTGRKPANCHRYDDSALNILLKNWYNFDMAQFARRNNYFRPYDESYKPKLKICRHVHDIKDSEL